MYAIRSYYETDFALNSEMLKSKFPFSKLVDKKVNTLIFPNLDSANITYKLLKELNESARITSYNVCYTKLLRHPSGT